MQHSRSEKVSLLLFLLKTCPSYEVAMGTSRENLFTAVGKEAKADGVDIQRIALVQRKEAWY